MVAVAITENVTVPSLSDRDSILSAINLTRTPHRLVRFLQAGLIQDLLFRMNFEHDQLLVRAADKVGIGHTAITKGLCIKGSATLPFTFRRPQDLDVSVNIGFPYNPAAQSTLFPYIFHEAVRRNGLFDQVALYLADLDDASLFPPGVQTQRIEKRMSVLYIETFVEVARIEQLVGIFREKFTISDQELTFLSRFDRETAEEIIQLRRASAPLLGTTYNPNQRESNLEGIRICISIDLIAAPQINVYSPYAMGVVDGGFRENFTSRKDPREKKLSYSPATEEAVSKLFSLVTSRGRSSGGMRVALDLVDLYIRTREPLFLCRAYSPFVIDQASLARLASIFFLTHPAFFGEGPYPKKIDPNAMGNRKQVAAGLLQASQQGLIGWSVFEKPISSSTAREYAELLLSHAWTIVEKSLFLKHAGTARNPKYTISPPESVKALWGLAVQIHDTVAKVPLTGAEAEKRADGYIAAIQSKLDQVWPGIDPVVRDTTALNIYLAADKSRRWVGIVDKEA